MTELPPGYVQRARFVLPIAVAKEVADDPPRNVYPDVSDDEDRRVQRRVDPGTKGTEVDNLTWPVPTGGDASLPFKIFDKQQVIAYTSTIGSGGSSDVMRARALVKKLESRGEYRSLATLPVDWREDLSRFEQRFPNFAEVIDYLRVLCALASQTDCVLHFCILLSGPAGTGKSMLAQLIGEWVGGGYACIRYESAQNSSELGGSSSFWSNTAPGRLFNMLTDGQYANPTFFLDEIDKVSAREYDPLGPLYALLEPGTARTFADLSWPFLQLDCSRINFIAACNDPLNIPDPIQARLRKFEIPKPTAEQALIIASNIISDERQRHAAHVRFSEAAINALCQLSPRRMRQFAQEALGRALLNGRDVVLVKDIATEDRQQRGIGFLG